MSRNHLINLELLNYFKQGLKPDPLMSINKWADTYRILPSESSSEPGKYRTDRMPYLEEIAYELSPESDTSEVTVIKGTQLGFTELGNNMLFCYAHLYPCPMLQILPTQDAVRTHAISKLWPSVKAASVLNEKIREKKTKDGSSNTELLFSGGSIKLGWSNSASTFASNSRRVVICDDIDRWPLEIEGGNPLTLAKNRTEGYPNNKKIYNNSSPAKKENSRIQPKYDNSSKALYTMKCPCCNEDIVFEKDGFKFEHDEEHQLEGDVVFICSKNGCIIEEHMKHEMMKKENGVRWVHEFPDRKHKGYRLPSYYSPFARWNEMFQDYLDAFKEMKQKKETISMAAWVNTKDAKGWEEKIKKIDISEFNDRHENYNDDVPDGVYFLTAGVDTQDDRLEVEIVGWGKYGESWSIDYKVLDGDPNKQKVWAKLDRVLEKSYKHESGLDLKIMGVAIDSGGHRTDAVYNYCRPRYEQNVYCIKGAKEVSTPILKGTPSRVSKGTVRLFSIGVNSAKDTINTYMKTKEVGPGFMHYPMKEDVYNEAYWNQLTAESRDKATGRWSKFRTRNEAIDVRVYALGALKILEHEFYPDGFDWDDIEEEFYIRVEESINNVDYEGEEKVEESTQTDEFNDWRDQY
jgi:phage terminase large subunit GpA-like protein